VGGRYQTSELIPAAKVPQMGTSAIRQCIFREGRPTLSPMKKLLVLIVVLALAAFAVKKLQDA
jgi:hypothetical protein